MLTMETKELQFSEELKKKIDMERENPFDTPFPNNFCD